MKFNCGVIGLGRIGCQFDENSSISKPLTHTGVIIQNTNSRLVTICDLDKTKLKKYGKKFHIKNSYDNYYEMFKNENLDCVSICTLPDTHYDIVKAASLNNVKGIFLEKPISLSLEDSKKIIKICKTKNIKLQIDHQRRFGLFYQKIKSKIYSQKFEPIQSVNILYGSGILNTGTHILDLLRYFFGDIKSVQGNFSSNSSNKSDDPNIDGSIIFQSGLICNLQSLDLKNFGILECDIIGSGGRFKIDLANSTTEFFEIKNTRGLVYRNLQKQPFIVNEKNSEIMNGFKNLLHSIETDTEPLCTGFDGYSSLQACLYLIKSAKNNGKTIDFFKMKN